ncbi:MAG: V-type ATP synthase subunit D [Gammaproteobacteria bacterium]|jgi:V/A-type H+-transporting ATPase subunit D
MAAGDLAPTRSVILHLREEQDVVLEAYDFLDEKRLLLAAELLRQLRRYEQLLQDYETLRQQAERALVTTISRHGFHGTQVYPGHYLEDADMQINQSMFMGVKLATTILELPDYHEPQHICHPSPEAEQCRHVFRDMVQLAGVIAGVSGNLHRLLAEYRRTERRARALENIVIPELTQQLRTLTTQLEELEQEDIVRVHVKHR